MKKILFLLIPALSGCVNLPSVVKALSQDPATVSIQISTVYGTVKFVRTNVGTNSCTVSPDGTVIVNK